MCECQEDGLGRPIWKGVSCEEKAAPCDLVDCGEHGVCHEDHHGKAQCQCSGGYTGARCDQISEDPDLRQPEDDQLTPKNSEKEGTTIVEKLRTWMTLAGVALGLMISLFMACRAYHKWKRVGYSQLSGGAIIGENGDQIQDDFYGL